MSFRFVHFYKKTRDLVGKPKLRPWEIVWSNSMQPLFSSCYRVHRLHVLYNDVRFFGLILCSHHRTIELHDHWVPDRLLSHSISLLFSKERCSVKEKYPVAVCQTTLEGAEMFCQVIWANNTHTTILSAQLGLGWPHKSNSDEKCEKHAKESHASTHYIILCGIPIHMAPRRRRRRKENKTALFDAAYSEAVEYFV